jgi:hypothetical protein
MQRAVRVVETYVPGLAAMTGAWYGQLQGKVAAALSAEGLDVALLAIPNDETLIWLVWSQLDNSDQVRDVAVVVLDVVAGGGSSGVLERAVDGHLVIGHGAETAAGSNDLR